MKYRFVIEYFDNREGKHRTAYHGTVYSSYKEADEALSAEMSEMETLDRYSNIQGDVIEDEDSVRYSAYR